MSYTLQAILTNNTDLTATGLSVVDLKSGISMIPITNALDDGSPVPLLPLTDIGKRRMRAIRRGRWVRASVRRHESRLVPTNLAGFAEQTFGQVRSESIRKLR